MIKLVIENIKANREGSRDEPPSVETPVFLLFYSHFPQQKYRWLALQLFQISYRVQGILELVMSC